jgi:hypothetical protein
VPGRGGCDSRHQPAQRPFGAVLRGPHGIPASGQSSSANGCEPFTLTGPWLGSKVLPLDIGRRAYCSASRLRENGMEASEVRRAVEAGGSTASAQGLQVDDIVVIHNSDRIALRLIPCDVLARVAPSAHQAGSEFEVEVTRRLTETDGPVAELEPGPNTVSICGMASLSRSGHTTSPRDRRSR